jgi:hypothetical protein
MKDTLLDRCTVAFQDAIKEIDYPAHTNRSQRAGVEAVLDHLSYELVTLAERRPSMTVHGLAMLLREKMW